MRFLKHFRDVLKFNQLTGENNKICVYCEGKNYWPHLKPIVEALITRTHFQINYVSSDQEDPGLALDAPNFEGFVIGEGFIRNYFFDNLKSKVVLMTMPDLDQYQIKKSPLVKHFVYVHHSLVSHHMVYRPKAFDAFDVIMCAGQHHNKEIKNMTETWSMPAKQVVDHGYGRLDSVIANRTDKPNNVVKKILVAPSWGENGALELMGEQLIDALMQLGHHVILRPHPQTVKFSQDLINKIVNSYNNNENFSFEDGVASEESLHQSDLMISDWSGAAFDYAFGLLKPVLFIDVPRKVQNSNYQELGVEPFESSIRQQIGVIQNMNLDGLEQNINALLSDEKNWSNELLDLRAKHVYNIGKSGQVAADAILELV